MREARCLREWVWTDRCRLVVILALEVRRPVSGWLLGRIAPTRQFSRQLGVGLLLAAVPDAMLDAELLVQAVLALEGNAILVQHFAPSNDILGEILRVMDCSVGRLPETNFLLGGICRFFFSQF